MVITRTRIRIRILRIEMGELRVMELEIMTVMIFSNVLESGNANGRASVPGRAARP